MAKDPAVEAFTVDELRLIESAMMNRSYERFYSPESLQGDAEELRRIARKAGTIATVQHDVSRRQNALEDRALAVTRLEVIDKTGRVYGNRPCTIELSFQDDDRTLKVFVNRSAK